jgi:HK97 family phage major capsid protein
MTVRSIPAEKLPVGAAFSKFLVCLSQRTNTDALAMADERCSATPQVAHALRQRLKSGVGAVTTATGLPIGTLASEFISLLGEASAALQIVRRCRHAPFKVPVDREIGVGAGAAWRNEALPAPLSATMFDQVTLPFTVIDVITTASRDAFRLGRTTEAALRASVIAGLSRYLDDRMLNPSVAAGAASPASLTYGAETITSTGTTAAQVLADLGAMIAAVNTPLTGGCWTMRKKTFTRICGALASVGYVASVDNLLGLPVVLGHGPQQIALLDLNATLAAFDEEGIAIEVSTLASLEMSDAPAQDGTTGGGASMVSLWQNNLLAIKTSLAVNWAPTMFNDGSPSQTAAAVVMTVDY